MRTLSHRSLMLDAGALIMRLHRSPAGSPGRVLLKQIHWHPGGPAPDHQLSRLHQPPRMLRPHHPHKIYLHNLELARQHQGIPSSNRTHLIGQLRHVHRVRPHVIKAEFNSRRRRQLWSASRRRRQRWSASRGRECDERQLFRGSCSARRRMQSH